MRLEHRFTMSDLEELKSAFGVSFIYELDKTVIIFLFQVNDFNESTGIELTKQNFAKFISSVANRGEEHEVFFN